MPQLSKQALIVENNTNFPNNNTGYITPTLLREFNRDMIDSLVAENVYNTDSSSWNAQIAALNPSSSAGSILALNAYTASQDTKNSTLASYTGSNDTKWSTLGGLTGSFVTESESGSFLISASVSLNTITFTKGNASTFSITVNTGSAGGATDITSLNAYTASQDTKNLAVGYSTSSLNSFTASNANTSLNSYTASNDTKWSTLSSLTSSNSSSLNQLNAFSASASSSIFNINAFTGSQITKNATLATYTSSLDTKNTTLATVTASLQGQLTNIGSQSGSWVTETESGSFLITASVNLNTITFTKGNNTTFAITVNTGSGGGGATDISSLNAYTASQDTKNLAVGYSTSSLNSYTASNDTKWSNLGSQSGSFITESETGSFARTNVNNNFSVNQTFTNITAVSASFQYVQTTYETSSVIYSSGSNQLGDAIDDVQTLIGTVIVSGSQKITGSLDVSSTFTSSLQSGYVLVGNGSGRTIALPTSSFLDDIPLTSLNAYTASQDNKNLAVGYSTSSLNSFTASQDTKNSTLATYTASVDTKWNTLGGQTGSYITSAQTSSMSVATASLALAVSTSISTQNLSHFVTFVDNSTGTQNLYVDGGLKYNPNQDLLTTTSSVAITLANGTGSLDNTSLNAYTASNDTKWNTLANVTSSLIQATGSYAVKSSANSFTGSQTISGSLIITGSAFGNVVSMSIASSTASLNLNAGNYFTISIPTGTTRISPSNIQAGTTATLVITTASGSLVTFDSSVKQPSGSAYVPTSGSVDVLSFVSVNSSNLYVVSTKNMI